MSTTARPSLRGHRPSCRSSDRSCPSSRATASATGSTAPVTRPPSHLWPNRREMTRPGPAHPHTSSTQPRWSIGGRTRIARRGCGTSATNTPGSSIAFPCPSRTAFFPEGTPPTNLRLVEMVLAPWLSCTDRVNPLDRSGCAFRRALDARNNHSMVFVTR